MHLRQRDRIGSAALASHRQKAGASGASGAAKRGDGCASRRAEVERLEGRLLLAEITWSNRDVNLADDIDSDGFAAAFAADAGKARQIVDVAIADWEFAIQNFNYGDTSHANEYNLILDAKNTDEGAGVQHFTLVDTEGKPYQGEIILDDDALGSGWFIPGKWLGESSFESGHADFGGDYKRTFIDAGGTTRLREPVDLYTTVLHEIGHAVGFSLKTGLRIHDFLTPIAGDTGRFNFQAGSTTATFNGSHLDSVIDLMEAFQPQFHRKLITPLDVSILRDAYDYTVCDPATLPKIGVLPAYWQQYCSYYNLSLPEGFGCTIQFLSSPPALDGIADQTIDEGSEVAFRVEARSPNAGMTFAFSLGAGAPAGATINSRTGDFRWTPGDGATTQSIPVNVSDGGITSVSSQSFNVTVNNVKPTAAVSGPGIGVRGQPRTFTFTATDPGTADLAAGFTYQIDWGDGITQTVTRTANNGGGVALDHAYAQSGPYTVKVTGTDKDGAASDEVSTPITIGAAGLQADTFGGGAMALVVGGTEGADRISFRPVQGAPGGSAGLQLLLNGASQGVFAPTSRLIVFGGDGNDEIQVPNGIGLPVFLYGGDGNDRLQGGGGAGALVGGGDNDELLGGNGRSLLIGGRGADRLLGNGADDVLIAGHTAFDADDASLAAILAEWTSTRVYATRVQNLVGDGTGDRANGDTFLRTTGPATVFNDGAPDRLTGAAGRDWFFADSASDILTGRAGDELLDLLA